MYLVVVELVGSYNTFFSNDLQYRDCKFNVVLWDYTVHKNNSQNLKANRNLVSPQDTLEMDLADSKMGAGVLMYFVPEI